LQEGEVTARGFDSRRVRAALRIVAAFCICLLLLTVLTATSSTAAVSDIAFTDVTTRSLSVVWASDEAVTTGTVRVYADPDGITELTSGLSLTLVSSSVPQAHGLGLVKVDVTGLAANTCYYVQTETTGGSTVQSPAAPPFPEVCTSLTTTKATGSGDPIANDLILHDVYEADGVTPADGALVLLSAPNEAAYPVSHFVGQGFTSPSTALDMNNLFDGTTGVSLEIAGGEVVELVEYRGLLCPGLTDHRLVRMRRAPSHEEAPALGGPITQLESADLCFFADTFCDDTIDVLDAQRVLNAFGGQPGDCVYNSDLDIVLDQDINVLDVQSVLNRLGESAPFN
jgi:hypothetical protein